MGLTVVTYGGGEILYNIFNAIAMLMNAKQGGLIQSLMIITTSIGLVWAVSKAFFSSSSQAFLNQFIFPLIAIVGIFTVPTATVLIEDVLKNKGHTVDHVPFLLAKFAELTSSIGYHITTGVEKTMHVPNDVSYNSTGMIFGADTAMDISRYKISNADLEKNLQTFCRQCILYDLHLGRYSIDELKKTTDLWNFLEAKTSKVNMMKYVPIGKKDQKPQGQYLSCKEAIKTMNKYFQEEKKYYGQLDVCKNLGLTFQALTGLQKKAEDLIGQQLMMNVIADEYSGNNFAKARAYIQQRNTYQALGSIASSSLVTLRAVIEALVYAAFIFVIPLSVLPGGLKCITTWAGLVVWIQLWPPFYAILNYIMQSVSHGYAETIFHGLNETQQGLSLFSSIGLNNLQQDIYALSGYLAASIPFIAYAILKGGVSSFVHLAGSMMSPAHSASSAAAAEQTTGNYSFANTSFGQTSYKNTSGLQTNLAPSLSGGFFQENSGTSSAIYCHDEQILKQSNSELRTSLFSDDSISQSMQTSKMHALSSTENAQKTYVEGISSHARNVADLSQHLANSENYSQGHSSREAYDLQESARYCENVAESFGKQYGLSTRASMELLVGCGWDCVITGKGTKGLGSNKEEALSEASNIVHSEEFQKHFQKIQDYSSSTGYNQSDEKGMRLSESCSQSAENMRSSQESFQIAQSELNQISENASWAEQNSHLIRRSLNQDFVNWSSEQFAHEGGFSKVQDLLNKGDSEATGALVTGFATHIRAQAHQMHAPELYRSPQEVASKELPNQILEIQAQQTVEEHLETSRQQFSPNLSEQKDVMQGSFSTARNTHNQQFDEVSSHIESQRIDAQDQMQSEAGKLLLERGLSRATDEITVPLKRIAPILTKIGVPLGALASSIERKTIGNFQIKDEPFWLRPEETR